MADALANVGQYVKTAEDAYHDYLAVQKYGLDEWRDFAQRQKVRKTLVTQLMANRDEDGDALTDEDAAQLFSQIVSMDVFSRLADKNIQGLPLEIQNLLQVTTGNKPYRPPEMDTAIYRFVAYRRGPHIVPLLLFEEETRLVHLQILQAYAPGIADDAEFVKRYIRGGLVQLSFNKKGHVASVDLLDSKLITAEGTVLELKEAAAQELQNVLMSYFYHQPFDDISRR